MDMSTTFALPLSTTTSRALRTRNRGARRVLEGAICATVCGEGRTMDGCTATTAGRAGAAAGCAVARIAAFLGIDTHRSPCSTSRRMAPPAIDSDSTRSTNAAPDGVCANTALNTTSFGRYVRMVSITDARLVEGNGI